MPLQRDLNTFSEFQLGHVYAIAKLMNCKILQRNEGLKPILVIARKSDDLPIFKWVFGDEPKILDMQGDTYIPLMTSNGKRYTISEWLRSMNIAVEVENALDELLGDNDDDE